MSHQDSSSQEYLDDTRYLDDDEDDEVYCEPPPNFQEIDASHLSSKHLRLLVIFHNLEIFILNII